MIKLLAAFLVLARIADADCVAADDSGILEWIRGEVGGSIHPDQEYRLDSNGRAGMFATESIARGQILARVPWSLVVKNDHPKEDPRDTPLACGMVTALARELRKGNHSSYAPFVNHLRTQDLEREIPSGWTPAGQRLLEDIVGVGQREEIPPSEPVDWISGDWYEGCGGDPSDSLGAKAALVVVKWNNRRLLDPVTGLYQHRNGKWRNADVRTTLFRNVVVIATRDIRKGEPIHLSRTRCQECGSRADEYGVGDLFRDRGEIEPMPQHWHFEGLEFDLDEDNSGELTLTFEEDSVPEKAQDREENAGWLRRQIRRLRRLRNIVYRGGNPGIPEWEWDRAWTFQQASIRAMSMAADALEAIDNPRPEKGNKHDDPSEWAFGVPHYDKLEYEVDDLDYRAETCYNDEIMDFEDYRTLEVAKTQYQRMKFEMHPETKDVVLELDHIVQIASVYRPQYHEFSVHYAARFLDSVKRVIFIGGGDSMLLHETLKYPDIELVVGLELDQMVVRKSFKYFHTQPHFDDPRVEWWFGDATKSLLLLSEEYWQSFDLVLVDLSETVMSFSVTGELDVFDALALLLKPEGVLVKNEQYLEPLSKVFDHSIHIVYECPIICDQVLTMGSNKIDFFHAPLKDHGIDNLLYEPLLQSHNRHDLLHDYRRNDAREQGKCGEARNATEAPEEQIKSAGIMAIIDAEMISAALDDSFTAELAKVVNEEGFHPIQAPVYQDGIIKIILKEGYIIARLFPDRSYANFDINLWGRFHKLKALASAIKRLLGSELVSSFRVVVGGMYESSTWLEDRDITGPKIVQTRNCEENEASVVSDEVHPTVDAILEASFDEILDKLLQSTDTIAVALCGTSDLPCFSQSKLEQSPKVQRTIRLSTCSSLDPTDASTLFDCEISVVSKLKRALHVKDSMDKIGLFVVDASAPYEMLQIVNSMLASEKFLLSIIDSDRNLFMAWSTNPQDEVWRKYFLDRYRKQYMDDPVSRAEYWIQTGDATIELGVVAAGNPTVAYNLEAVENSFADRFPPHTVNIALTRIDGGKYAWWDPWEPPEFLQSDYNNEPGLTQYFKQEPLAHLTIFQFEQAKGNFDFRGEVLRSALQTSTRDVFIDCSSAMEEFSSESTQVKDRMEGRGRVLVCLDGTGSTVVAVWDGRSHLDVSFYRTGPNSERLSDKFLRSFLHATGGKLELALRDDMPRGTGRVVNMVSDIMTAEERDNALERIIRRRPRFAEGREYDDHGNEWDDDDDSEDDEVLDIPDL